MTGEHHRIPPDSDRSPRGATGTEARKGQAIVEFAIVSVAFFLMVFGTIDFGRAIFMYTQLNNAVREGARYGKVTPSDTTGIKQAVVSYSSSLSISTSDVSVKCDTSPCSATSSYLRVSVSDQFQAITQQFLGISPITLSAESQVVME